MAPHRGTVAFEHPDRIPRGPERDNEAMTKSVAHPERINRFAEQWVHGWAIARSTPAPVRVPHGYRLDVGLPGHRTRHVLTDPGPVARLSRILTAPDTWLKVCGPREAAVSTLDPRWRVGETEYLMTVELSPDPVPAPDHYTVKVTESHRCFQARAWSATGTEAASSIMALHAGTAVFDRVVTDPDHRRRGLGRALMNTLGRAAFDQGAEHGLLVATDDGRGLYERLGWELVCPVTPARLMG